MSEEHYSERILKLVDSYIRYTIQGLGYTEIINKLNLRDEDVSYIRTYLTAGGEDLAKLSKDFEEALFISVGNRVLPDNLFN